MMSLTQEGIDLIKRFEGCRLHAYKDIVGVVTIGYGNTGKDIVEGMTITQQQADDMLIKRLNGFVQTLDQLLKVELNSNQFNALLSLIYNIGSSALDRSTLLADVNAGQFGPAASQFLRFDHAGGIVRRDLQERRAAEKALFQKPVTP